MEELKCKVCGKLASEDSHFIKGKQLCRRHNQQFNKYGKFLDDVQPLRRFCDIYCDTLSTKYYKWNKDGELKEKTLCNRHYLQMCNHGKLLDNALIQNNSRHKWTKNEGALLEKSYSEFMSMGDMVKLFNLSQGSITDKAVRMGLTEKYVKKNSRSYKSPYQNYDWCYERYINRGMSHQEMADELGVKKRVIEKWCSDIHKLNNHTFRREYTLSALQKELIMFGLLGDGHIDKRETQPMYIESHAENQKDYIYWKYNILKDICNKEPKEYKEKDTYINGNKCHCQKQYRLNTKILDDLYEIRNMRRIDIIKNLNEFGLSLHVLDDGYRGSSNWELCLAEYSDEEIDLYIQICNDIFNLDGCRKKDERYIQFTANSSRIIDEIILRNIPNNLDIIKYKITENKICKPNNYIYILTSNGTIGLNAYCRTNKLPYNKCHSLLIDCDINEITEDDLSNLLKEA